MPPEDNKDEHQHDDFDVDALSDADLQEFGDEPVDEVAELEDAPAEPAPAPEPAADTDGGGDDADAPTTDDMPRAVSAETEQFLTRVPSLAFRGTTWVLVFLLVVGLIWSSIATVDEVVTGKGFLVPREGVQLVEATAEGRLIEVMAQGETPLQEGVVVEEGADLFRIAPIVSPQVHQQRQDELRAARREAQENLPGRIQEYNAQIAAYQEQRVKLERQRATAESAYQNQIAQFDLTARDLEAEVAEVARQITLEERSYEQTKSQLEAELARTREDIKTENDEHEAAMARLTLQLEVSRLSVEKAKEEAELAQRTRRAMKPLFDDGQVRELEWNAVDSRATTTKIDLQRVQREGQLLLQSREETVIAHNKRLSTLEAKEDATRAAIASAEIEHDRQMLQLSTLQRTTQHKISQLALDRTNAGTTHQNELDAFDGQIAQMNGLIAQQQLMKTQDQQQVLSRVRAAEDAVEQLEPTTIKAPESGVVTFLLTENADRIVRVGDLLARIAPKSQEGRVDLVAEVAFQDDDIRFVEEGGPVKLKFDAFDYRQFGTQEGEIEKVPEETATGSRVATGVTGRYYLVRVRLANDKIVGPDGDDGEGEEFRMGMEVTAEAVGATRSLLSQFLSPVEDLFGGDRSVQR
jgi:hemolysin D